MATKPPSQPTGDPDVAPTNAELKKELATLRTRVNTLPDKKAVEALVREFIDASGQADPQRLSAISEQVAGFNSRLDKLEKAQKATQSQVDSVRSTVSDLGSRVAEDHDAIVDVREQLASLGLDVEQIMLSLEAGSVGGRRSFIDALRSRNVDDAKIARVIGELESRVADMNLSDEELFASWFEAYASFKEDTFNRLNKHQERLNEHETRIDDVETQNEIQAKAIGRMLSKEKNVDALWYGLAASVLAGAIIWAFSLLAWTWVAELGLVLTIGFLVAYLTESFAGDEHKLTDTARAGYQQGKAKAKSRKSKSKPTPAKAEGPDNPKGNQPNGASESSDVPQPEPAPASS